MNTPAVAALVERNLPWSLDFLAPACTGAQFPADRQAGPLGQREAGAQVGALYGDKQDSPGQ
jgi:hypothetical protein